MTAIKVIKNTYHKASLLLLHVFVFKQKNGTRNFGAVVLCKFSNNSTDAIKQISTYWMQIGVFGKLQVYVDNAATTIMWYVSAYLSQRN